MTLPLVPSVRVLNGRVAQGDQRLAGSLLLSRLTLPWARAQLQALETLPRALTPLDRAAICQLVGVEIEVG